MSGSSKAPAKEVIIIGDLQYSQRAASVEVNKNFKFLKTQKISLGSLPLAEPAAR